MLLLSGFLQGIFPLHLNNQWVQWDDLEHSYCRNIQQSAKGLFYSCEQYNEGKFRFSCGIRVVLPALSALCQPVLIAGRSARHYPRDNDCPGFIWFEGERLFSTPNLFMDFPLTDVRRAPAKLSICCTAIKVISLPRVTTGSAHNYWTHTANEHQRSRRSWGTSVGWTSRRVHVHCFVFCFF